MKIPIKDEMWYTRALLSFLTKETFPTDTYRIPGGNIFLVFPRGFSYALLWQWNFLGYKTIKLVPDWESEFDTLKKWSPT